MNSKFNSIVSNTEVNALKEMILKRASEKAEQKTEEEHVEIMDMARNSFVSKNNPFSQIANNNINTTPKTSSTDITNMNESEAKSSITKHEIGFPIRQQDKVIQNKVLNEIKQQALNNNMNEARASLNQNQKFNNAIEFLNSQALVSLLKVKSQNFEILV